MAKRIVIAEDDKSLRKALSLKLTHDGYEVKETVDGNTALAVIKEGGVDLLLLDIMMPGLDGFGVLEQLKKDGAKFPVVVTTNLGQEEDKKKALQLGATDYLVKSDQSLDDIIALIIKRA